jgi:N utilization substance protein B
MKDRRKARILAFQALYSWDVSGSDIKELAEFSWAKDDCDEDIRSFALFLVKGTLESINEIDSMIKKKLIHWDFERLARVDLALLRVSVYSLLYQNDIPEAVTINEAIEIAKEFGSDNSYKFINGILDNVRKKE